MRSSREKRRKDRTLKFGQYDRNLDCPECGAPMQIVKLYDRRPFYSCIEWPDCDGAHGAHPNGDPLGIPAKRAVKDARIAAHDLFDQIWMTKIMTRARAYAWMRKALGLSKEEAHISRFMEDECARLVAEIGKRWPHLQSSK